MNRRAALTFAACVAVVPAVVQAGVIEGRVFVDANRDGLLSRGEQTLSGVVVAWEATRFAVSGTDGAYRLAAPDEPGIVWARVPDGFRPSPVWAQVAAAGGTADLPLIAQAPEVGASFAVASDLHIGRDELGRPEVLDTAAATASLVQAAALDPPPRFLAITGDLVQSNQPQFYSMLAQAAADLDLPLVPVPGNHDWFDGGASYRAALGPTMYSFDSGQVHFVVLNDNVEAAAWQAFLARDLEAVADGVPVVAFVHQPPGDAELDALEEAGVDTLFTGHWHANMTLRRGSLLELNTEPLVRGGLDGTPAGFRVVTIGGGSIAAEHRTIVDRELLAVVAPAINQCADGDRVTLVVAAGSPRGFDDVRAVFGGRTITLAPAGAWSWSADISVSSAIPQILRVEATRADASVATAYHPVLRCPVPAAGGSSADWPQLGGGAHHRGASAREIPPPLVTRWARALGAHASAPPVVAGGAVLVPLADFNDGARGGVVALDLASGDELWRFEPGADVRNAVAVGDGVVVVGAADGIAHGLDAATGAPLWHHDMGQGLSRNTSVLHAPPAIDGDVVYVAVHRNVAALDLATGAPRWSADPAPDGYQFSSRAAPAIGAGLVVGVVGRGRGGAFAWSAVSGAERWRLAEDDSLGMHAAPVIAGDVAYLVNGGAEVMAIELADGLERWRTQVVAEATSWDVAVQATPALAGGRLFVPTQYDDLVALDAATGAELWRISALDSVLHDAHARSGSSSFPSPPVVTGDVLWIAGGDGILRALDPATGVTRWSLDLGVPGNGGIAPAGDTLVIATYDGSVRAMVTSEER